MTNQVRLYKNTGFDSVNIPDNVNLLNQCEYIDVDAIWTYQNQELATIRIKTNFGDVYAVDYARIGPILPGTIYFNSYYFVTSVIMLNPTTAELTLQIDAISTIGVEKIYNSILSGWCNRRCVVDDTLFNNIIDEDFTPTQPLEHDEQIIKLSNTGILCIVSTIDLDKIDNLAEVYKASLESAELNVVVPTVPVIDFNYTKIIIDYQGLEIERELVGKRLYLIDTVNDTEEILNKYQKALRDVWSLGLSDAISAIYYLPIGTLGTLEFNYNLEYMETETQTSALKFLKIFGGSVPVNKIPFKWNIEIKNNKVFATKYNNYRLISCVSGNEAIYYAGDIYNKIDESEYPNIAVNLDGSDNGTVYAKPEYIKGVDLSQSSQPYEIFRDAVTGGSWIPFNYNNPRPKGIIKTLNELNYTNAFAGLNELGNILGSASRVAINTMPTGKNLYEKTISPYDPGTPGLVSQQQLQMGAFDSVQPITSQTVIPANIPIISGLANLAGSLYNSKVNKIGRNINASNQLVQTPQTWFPIDETMSLFIGNSFYIIRERLSDSDSKKFDRYLTMFGYSVNEPLTRECFMGRQYFNYIECSDLTLGVIQNIPLRLKELAIEQLENGIRIWHTLVNPSAYNNNPIVPVG